MSPLKQRKKDKKVEDIRHSKKDGRKSTEPMGRIIKILDKELHAMSNLISGTIEVQKSKSWKYGIKREKSESKNERKVKSERGHLDRQKNELETVGPQTRMDIYYWTTRYSKTVGERI